AMAAGEVWLDRTAIPKTQTLVVRWALDDNSGQLVSQHARIGVDGMGACEGVEVAPANANPFHANQRMARRHARKGRITLCKLTGCFQDDLLHIWGSLQFFTLPLVVQPFGTRVYGPNCAPSNYFRNVRMLNQKGDRVQHRGEPAEIAIIRWMMLYDAGRPRLYQQRIKNAPHKCEIRKAAGYRNHCSSDWANQSYDFFGRNRAWIQTSGRTRIG